MTFLTVTGLLLAVTILLINMQLTKRAYEVINEKMSLPLPPFLIRLLTLNLIFPLVIISVMVILIML